MFILAYLFYVVSSCYFPVLYSYVYGDMIITLRTLLFHQIAIIEFRLPKVKFTDLAFKLTTTIIGSYILRFHFFTILIFCVVSLLSDLKSYQLKSIHITLPVECCLSTLIPV